MDFDELLDTVNNEHMAMAAGASPEFTKIPGSQPSIGREHGFRGLLITKIPRDNAAAADDQLARSVVLLNGLPISINEAQFKARQGVSAGPEDNIIPVGCRHYCCGLSEAVALDHVAARNDIAETRQRLPVESRSPDPDALDAGEIVRLDNRGRVCKSKNKRWRLAGKILVSVGAARHPEC